MIYIDPGLEQLDDGQVVTTVLDLDFRPGTGSDVERLLAPAIDRTRAEAGCLEFRFLRVVGRPDHYVMFERWRDKSALQQHFTEPYFRDVVTVFNDYLAFPLAELTERSNYYIEVDGTSGPHEPREFLRGPDRRRTPTT